MYDCLFEFTTRHNYQSISFRITFFPSPLSCMCRDTALAYVCSGCATFTLQPFGRHLGDSKFGQVQGPPVGPQCSHCHAKHHIIGPFYSGPLHSKVFVEKLLKHIQSTPDGSNDVEEKTYGTRARMLGMVTVVSEVYLFFQIMLVHLFRKLMLLCTTL